MRGNFVTDRSGINNPNYKHGGKGTRLYSIWANMKTRCSNPKHMHFDRYGARGITVCDEWKNDFLKFYDWAMSHGYEDHLTIDRIDNDGNYEPSNCRWVSVKQQGLNRFSNLIVTINGVSKCLTEWCEEYGVNYKTVKDRLKRGWTYEDALSKTVQVKFGRKVN